MEKAIEAFYDSLSEPDPAAGLTSGMHSGLAFERAPKRAENPRQDAILPHTSSRSDAARRY